MIRNHCPLCESLDYRIRENETKLWEFARREISWTAGRGSCVSAQILLGNSRRWRIKIARNITVIMAIRDDHLKYVGEK